MDRAIADRATGPAAETASSVAGSPRVAAVASCGIAVMAKASVPGLTKTRLVPPLTHEQAAALNTAFLQDVTGNMLLAAQPSGAARFHRWLRRLWTAGVGGVFPPPFFSGDRLDRGVAAEFRRLPVPRDLHDSRPRSRRGRGAQCRQSHVADGAAQRDRRSADAARRSRRARALERRWLLSARAEGRSSAHVRGYSLEHGEGRRADSARGRARSVSTCTNCPCGTTSTTARLLRRLHGELRLCEAAGVRSAAPERGVALHHARHTAELFDRLWPDGEFTRGSQDAVQIEKAGV